MINPIITANIFSKLGNSASLLPIAVKDASHSAGMTTASYITGKEVEGKDRLIDEFGTQAIWLGGLPFFKKAIDLTVYKIAKHNPNVDIRLLKDEKVVKAAIKNAPTKEIAESIKHAADHAPKFKALSMVKFIAATVFTLGSYWALTTFRHKHTEKALVKEVQQELQQENSKKQLTNEAFQGKKPQVFSNFGNNKQGKNPSFGNGMKALSDFMFNPVKNMMIVDGGITAERLAESRNPQDFGGYVIKEGSFWLFMYFAGQKIQEMFEKIAEKKHNKAIDLDIRALQSPKLKKFFKSGKVQESIDEFKNIVKTEIKNENKKKTLIDKVYEYTNNNPNNPIVKTAKKIGIIKERTQIIEISNPEEVYDFICTHQNNLVVKLAKKSGIIENYKEGTLFNKKKTAKIDTQKYIDLEEVKGVGEKLEKLYNQYKNSGEDIEKFMAKTIKLKRGSILKNIGVCVGALGMVVPGIVLAMRLMDKDNKEFQVKKQVKEKMMAESFQGASK